MMYEHLQKWGPRKQEVKFYLRHEESPTESSDQGKNAGRRPRAAYNHGALASLADIDGSVFHTFLVAFYCIHVKERDKHILVEQ